MELEIFFGALIATVLFAILLREVFTWYWKINLSIRTQNKTNVLLERLLIQMGSVDKEITIEEISTGKKKRVTVEAWVDELSKYPKLTGYRIIKNEDQNEAK